MRLHGRTDDNQREVVQALRDAGRSVLILSDLGDGAPDLLVGWGQSNMLLMEVKDGSKPPSAQKLTPAEEEFHRTWRGPVCVVRSPAEALAATGVRV